MQTGEEEAGRVRQTENLKRNKVQSRQGKNRKMAQGTNLNMNKAQRTDRGARPVYEQRV